MSPGGAEITRRREIIEPVKLTQPGTAERADAIAELARSAGVSKRTLYRWLKAKDQHGLGGLARGDRSDKGKRRNYVTSEYDNAMRASGLEALLPEIAAELDRRIRSLWACNTEWGVRKIAALAGKWLQDRTAEAGFDCDARQLKKMCRVTVRRVQRWQSYRDIAIHDHDAKRWDDGRPRIRRTKGDRKPLWLVFGDVHPMDVLLPRPDGSTFTAKLACFQDWATNRIFVYPVFLEPGEGVRQEHIAEAFIAMTQAPGWGLPQNLYIDNGGEYGHADLIADAMRLNTQFRLLTDDQFNALAQEPDRPVRRAQPYNAAAKAIEGMFGVLERTVFSALPGWIGGNRMVKKTANVGREPVPYPHGKAEFLRDLNIALEAFETMPQSGQLNGRSPREVFNAFVDDGWGRTDISRATLLAVFARDESREVRKGGFSYNGEFYTAPEIWELPAGSALHLRAPIFGGRHPDQIPVIDSDGGLLCMAAVDRPYDALDPEGARDVKRRKAKAKAGVKARRGNIDPLDGRKVLADFTTGQEPEAVPESAQTVRGTGDMEAMGGALERTPAERRAAKRETEEAEREAQRAHIEILKRFHNIGEAEPESDKTSRDKAAAARAELKRIRATG